MIRHGDLYGWRLFGPCYNLPQYQNISQQVFHFRGFPFQEEFRNGLIPVEKKPRAWVWMEDT